VIVDDERRARLLAAIDGGVGVDGREDEGAAGNLFRELRFQRKAIFRAEQKTAMGEDPGPEDGWSWDILFETSADYLDEYGKDLEPAAILVEAAVRTSGLPGLVSATALLVELIETYWDAGLYPHEDEDDGIDARFQPLSGLSGGSSDKDGTLVIPLRRMVIAGSGDDELRYLDRAVADAQLVAARSGREDLANEAKAALDEIEAKARRAGRTPLAAAAAQIATAEESWRRAVGFISERTKPRFPAASKVSDELRNIREWVESLMRLLPEDIAINGEPPVSVDASTATQPAAATSAAFSIGRIERREDALRAVVAAAEYFQRNEPLSPIGTALREIDRRARLSFEELLTELIPDYDSRNSYYWRSGIKPPANVE